eukprot:scaffold265074_cov28-Tisochrysis_lutea.AAC.3
MHKEMVCRQCNVVGSCTLSYAAWQHSKTSVANLLQPPRWMSCCLIDRPSTGSRCRRCSPTEVLVTKIQSALASATPSERPSLLFTYTQ